MSRLYIITGTSRGIGYSIAQVALMDSKSRVYGISRTRSIEHENFIHIEKDLLSESKIDWPDEDSFDEIILINNAGTLGEIGHFGELSNSSISQCIELNLTKVMLLCNDFIKRYRKSEKPLLVLNISSGAAQRPIESWAAYCASKAGLDMFSEVLQIDAHQLGIPLQVLSVAPGVVETKMQESIRSTSAEDFSAVTSFRQLKEENALKSPELAGKQIIELINRRTDLQDVIVRLN